MAQETVGIKVQVDGSEAVQSVGSLKKQLREAQAEVAALSDKFGATSAQAVEAAKRAADLKDRIGDAKALTDAFNPDRKFQAFASSLQGVVGGFTAVQGALGLVGVESDQVQQTLLKVQSAMALSQGINSVLEARDSFKNLGTVIQSTTLFQKANNAATVAAAAVQRAFGIAVSQTSIGFKALKVAIASTGIGLLVVGLGSLIGKITSWIGSTDSAKAANERLNRTIEEQNRLFDKNRQKVQQAREDAIAEAKIKGKSAEEIYKINQTFNAKDLDLAQKNYEEKYKLLTDYEKNTLETFTKDGQTRVRGTEKELEQYEKLTKEFQDAQAQRDAARRKGVVDEQTENIRIADEARAKQQEASNKRKQASEQEAAKQKQKREKEEQERKERIEAEKRADEEIRLAKQENFLATIKDEDERAKKRLEFDLQNRYLEIQALNVDEKRKGELRLQAAINTQREIDRINEEARKKQQEKEKERLDIIGKNALESLEKTKQSIIERQKAISDVLSTEQEKELYNIAEQFGKRFQLIKGNQQAEAALTEEFEKQKTDIKLKYENQRLDIAKSALSNIANVVGKETAAGKAIAIASATIDTYQAANKALKADYGVFGPAAQVARFVAVASTIAVGIKNIREIAKAKVPNAAGGASASVPSGLTSAASAPIAPATPQAALTQLDQTTINRLGSATNRAYVVESDVTNSQERIRRINRAARLN